MEAEGAIITLLQANATLVTALGGGNKIFFAQAPETVALPYVVLFRVLTRKHHTVSGPVLYATALIQVDVYTKSLTQGRDLGTRIRNVIDGYRGIVSSVNLQSVLQEDQADNYDEESDIYQTIQDYEVSYIES